MTPLEADVIAAAEQYEEAWRASAWRQEARENAHIALIAAVRARRKAAAITRALAVEEFAKRDLGEAKR